MVLLLCACTRSVPSSTYGALRESFARYEAEEGRYFDRLVFSVAPRIFSKSNTYKVLLLDQHGDEWLFKASANGASDGIVAVYRVMNLFGLDSPEVHYKTLVFNGEPLEGTVQRFVKNRGGLSNTLLQKLKPATATYLAKSHVISWLLANHQVHYDQFLVLGPSGSAPATGILRIDNSINWFLLGQDRIDIDYRTPILQDFGNVGYYQFWQNFIGGKIQFSLPAVYQWARLIADFPDEAYRDFFTTGIEHGLDQLANNGAGDTEGFRAAYPDVMARAPRKGDVLRRLVERKHNLPRDLGALYRDIAAWRGEASDIDGGWDPGRIAAELAARLDRMTAEVRAREASPEMAGRAEQPALRVQLSMKALKGIRRIAKLMHLPARERELELDEVRWLVEKVALEAAIPEEKAAARAAIRNLEKFRVAMEAVQEGRVSKIDFQDVSLDLPKFFSGSWPELDELIRIAKSDRAHKYHQVPASGSEW